MPILDPAVLKVLKWEGENKDFPHGPMYWVNTEKENEMEAIAVGSVDEKQRKEAVCVVTKMLADGEDSAIMNGHATAGGEVAIKDGLLDVPTQLASLAETSTETNPNVSVTAPVVQEGEVVPASRPEMTTFVTAHEGLETLTLNEKAGNLPNGIAAPDIATVDGQTGGANGAEYPYEENGNTTHDSSVAEELKEKIEEAVGKVQEGVPA